MQPDPDDYASLEREGFRLLTRAYLRSMAELEFCADAVSVRLDDIVWHDDGEWHVALRCVDKLTNYGYRTAVEWLVSYLYHCFSLDCSATFQLRPTARRQFAEMTQVVISYCGATARPKLKLLSGRCHATERMMAMGYFGTYSVPPLIGNLDTCILSASYPGIAKTARQCAAKYVANKPVAPRTLDFLDARLHARFQASHHRLKNVSLLS